MTFPGIEESLSGAEAALESGDGLTGTGFWQTVATVKELPELVDRYANRIAAIDERAHRSWALLVIPLRLGTLLALLATIGGVALVGWAYSLEGWAAVVVFFLGFGVLVAATHGLGHLVVGSLVGIRFSYWFVGEIRRPQPGVKVEYGSYLRAKPWSRAWMHASGAIVTKLIPFLLIGAAIAADLPVQVAWVLAGLGAATIVTDAVWSTKASDWKKFRREMKLAQDS